MGSFAVRQDVTAALADVADGPLVPAFKPLPVDVEVDGNARIKSPVFHTVKLPLVEGISHLPDAWAGQKPKDSARR